MVILKRRVALAAAMAVITGSLTVSAGILWNYGSTPQFWHLWRHTVVVVYPTIMFCILVIAPRVQRLIDRHLPLSA